MTQEITKPFDSEGFYRALAASVKQRSITWKDVSRETGVSPTTLTRMAQGRQPDASGLASLAAWSGLNPAEFVSMKHRPERADALAVISTILRGDSNLSPEAAGAIEAMVQSAYTQLRRR